MLPRRAAAHQPRHVPLRGDRILVGNREDASCAQALRQGKPGVALAGLPRLHRRRTPDGGVRPAACLEFEMAQIVVPGGKLRRFDEPVCLQQIVWEPEPQTADVVEGDARLPIQSVATRRRSERSSTSDGFDA